MRAMSVLALLLFLAVLPPYVGAQQTIPFFLQFEVRRFPHRSFLDMSLAKRRCHLLLGSRNRIDVGGLQMLPAGWDTNPEVHTRHRDQEPRNGAMRPHCLD